MKIFLALLALFVGGLDISSAQTYIPIAARPPGYLWQSPPSGTSTKVVLDIYYEHLCSDSKAQWNDIMEPVVKLYEGKALTVVMHIVSLPYHHNSYFAEQEGVKVRELDSPKFKDYVNLMFKNQDSFLEAAANLTEPEVQEEMARLTSDSLGLCYNKLMTAFTDPIVKQKSIYAWEYGVSRGIFNPPMFMLNDVLEPRAYNYTIDEWVDRIDELFIAPY